MTPFIQQALADRTLGLALHYPLIHAAVVGLNARRTLEFGAGGSTRVITDAIDPILGRHISISTEQSDDLASKYEIGRDGPWRHYMGRSDEYRAIETGPLDLVLHDGSHAADVVAADIAWVWPYLRTFGLLLVHDTMHSYCGEQVRDGIRRGLGAALASYTATTLPYGFGLTIIRREDWGGPGVVEPAPAKQGSPHTTALTEFMP